MSRNLTKIVSKSAAPAGQTPAIVLIDPKFAHNVGMVVRLASCYGIPQVWYTGDRVAMDIGEKGRLPREERMKGYRDVEVFNYDRPLEQFKNAVPVAVEVREKTQTLLGFEHPKNAVYVFGPEDGSIPSHLLQYCQRFVIIPTRHCLNLATACATILWDRQLKAYQSGELQETTPGEFEARGFCETPEGLFFRK